MTLWWRAHRTTNRFQCTTQHNNGNSSTSEEALRCGFALILNTLLYVWKGKKSNTHMLSSSSRCCFIYSCWFYVCAMHFLCDERLQPHGYTKNSWCHFRLELFKCRSVRHRLHFRFASSKIRIDFFPINGISRCLTPHGIYTATANLPLLNVK